MTDTLAWWISFAESGKACVVETAEDGDVLDAVCRAIDANCLGAGPIRATFLPAAEMAARVPRRLWGAIRSADEWRAAGVDAASCAVPPGEEPCPFCQIEDAIFAGGRN